MNLPHQSPLFHTPLHRRRDIQTLDSLPLPQQQPSNITSMANPSPLQNPVSLQPVDQTGFDEYFNANIDDFEDSQYSSTSPFACGDVQQQSLEYDEPMALETPGVNYAISARVCMVSQVVD